VRRLFSPRRRMLRVEITVLSASTATAATKPTTSKVRIPGLMVNPVDSHFAIGGTAQQVERDQDSGVGRDRPSRTSRGMSGRDAETQRIHEVRAARGTEEMMDMGEAWMKWSPFSHRRNAP